MEKKDKQQQDSYGENNQRKQNQGTGLSEARDTSSENKTLSEERDEFLAGWQRAQADLQNLKKQHADERSTFTSLGKESLLQDLIPMLDNFEAAFANRDVWESVDENWRVGIEYIYNQFHQVLDQHGVKTFGQAGDEFNSSEYESVELFEVENEDDKDKVLEVIQKGYKIGDKIIRPAKVKVGG